MVDLSGVRSVEPGKYELDGFDLTQVSDVRMRAFLDSLIRDRHLVYDWGKDYFFACKVPFVVCYDQGAFLAEDGAGPIGDDQWEVGLTSETLHALLSPVFKGEWGPTSVDIILRMESSGIKIDLCGLTEYGPENPREFLEELRKSIGR